MQLLGLGTLIVRECPARTARNPRTGEKVEVPASRTVAFKPGKALKGRINGLEDGDQGKGTACCVFSLIYRKRRKQNNRYLVVIFGHDIWYNTGSRKELDSNENTLGETGRDNTRSRQDMARLMIILNGVSLK